MFPPYAPSFKWYAVYLKSLCDGTGEEKAIEQANKKALENPGVLARTTIGSQKPTPVLLSIPLSGGSSVLKKRGATINPLLSGHGNWPRIHLGAIEALYGRKPYFIHLMPHLKAAYENLPESLRDFNYTIHTGITAFLLQDCNPRDIINSVSSKNKTIVAEKGKEMIATINPGISVVEPLMIYGPETILPLLYAIP